VAWLQRHGYRLVIVDASWLTSAPESVKIFWTPSCQFVCSRVESLGELIAAMVGSLGGSGRQLNRSGLRA
jgi:hypothetical protein